MRLTRTVYNGPMPLRPAKLHGGPAPQLDVAGLVDLLPRAAARRLGPAVHLIDANGVTEHLSYADILDAASRVHGGLAERGVTPGDRVVILVEDSGSLLVAFWACVLGGYVAAPVSAAPFNSIADMRHMLGCRWLVTDDAIGPPPWDIADEVRPTWLGTISDLAEYAPVRAHLSIGSHPALLVKTAGSSGPPKAVVLSHGNLLGRSAATVADNELTSDIVTFNWMPLDHVGGLVMFHVRDVFLACEQVHAKRSWVMEDPLRWLDVIHETRACIAWATNSALDLIATQVQSQPERHWDLSCLCYVMNGGEPVRARTLHRFTETLAPHGLSPGAVRPGWGMTETAGGVVDQRLQIQVVHDDDRFVPVGRPHSGMSVRVVDHNGLVIPEGTVGHLQVRGSSVMSGYAGFDAIHDGAITPDGWLDTGDLAYVENRSLVVTGSSADAIWIEDVLHHGHEIEATVGELPFIDSRFVGACLAADPAQSAAELVIVYHHVYAGMSEVEAARHIRRAVLERHGLTVAHVLLVSPDCFPKTRTGKPQRSRLRSLAESLIARRS